MVNGNEDKKEKEDSTSPTDVLGGLTNPKVKVALTLAEQFKKLLQTSSSSHISSREKTSGFEFLNVKANAQSAKGLPKFLLTRIINRSLKPFAAIDKDMKEIVYVFEQYVKYDVEEFQDQSFAIISNMGRGQVQAIFLYFKLREDGKYNFKKLLFNGKFKLAADLVITRETKKGFLKSSSKDVIRYLPRRGIQEQDIDMLLKVMIPKIAKIMGEFIPPNE